MKHFCFLLLLYFDEQAESAIVALNCSGMVLGTQPIRCELNKFIFYVFDITLLVSYPYFLIS